MSQNTEDVLTHALQKGHRFHVISLSRESRHEGHLVEMDDEELQLVLVGELDVLPQDAVSVAFSSGPHTYSFLTRILDVDGDRVWVAAPEELLSADRRLRPRLPLTTLVRVTFEGVPGAYRARDLSPIGLSVEPPLTPAPPVSTETVATLSYGDHAVTLRAELRHATATKSGFFFVGSVDRGRVRALPGLGELIAALTEA